MANKTKQSSLLSERELLKQLSNIDFDRIARDRRGNEENIKIIAVVPLLELCGYDKENMDFEHPILRNKKADIALFVKETDIPDVIVETKSLDFNLDDALMQALNYAYEKGVNIVVLSNGREIRVYKSYIPKTIPEDRLIFSCKWINLPTNFAKLKRILSAKSIEKIIKTEEERVGLLISDKKFESIVQECRNIMRNASEKPKTGIKAFIEFNKILFIKIWEDEKKEDDISYERNLTVKKIEKKSKNYVNGIFKDLKDDYKKKGVVLFETDEIDLSKATIMNIVALLEPYNLYRSAVSAKGKVYENFIDEIFRGQEGQYFTPRTIVNFMVNLAGVEYGENGMKVLDPACGSGGFIITAFEKMKKDIDNAFKNIKRDEKGEIISWEYKNENAKKEWENAFKNLKHNLVFGFDNNEDLAATSRMNMILHGDGSSNVFYVNSLDKTKHADEKFDLILTNPPFGMTVGMKNKETKKIPEEDKKILRQYILTKKRWDKNKKRVVDCTPQARDSQILFLERNLDLLKDGGILCTVIDEGVLSNLLDNYVREHIRERAIIKAIISLPEDTFKSKQGGAKASILLLEKKKAGSIQGKIFASIPEHVGITPTGEVDIDLLPKVLKIYKEGKWKEEVIKEPLCFSIDPKLISERLDAKYFRPDYIELERELRNHKFDCIELKKISDYINTGKTPAKEEYTDKEDENLIIIKVATISNWGIEWDNVFFAKKSSMKTDKGKLQNNDILIISSAHSAKSIGSKIDIVQEDKMPNHFKNRVFACGELMILRLKEEYDNKKINPLYILSFLKSEYGQKQIERIVRGQTAHIYPEDIGKILILLPNEDDIQTQIANKMEDTRKKVNKYKLKLFDTINESNDFINNILKSIISSETLS